jgi:RHS repeat-associated protein
MDLQYSYSATQGNGQITQSQDYVSGEQVTYQYDRLRRLVAAATAGPEWGLKFTYDGFGNRLSQEVTKGTAPTVYPRREREHPGAAERDNAGLGRGEPGGDGDGGGNGGDVLLCAGRQAGVPEGGGRDAVHLLLRGDGGADRDVLYGPYGEQKTTTQGDDVRFATYMRDSVTGLDYAVNRYYSSIIERFLSPDPYVSSGGLADPQSWNRYSYTRNDPVNRYDPSALEDSMLAPELPATPTVSTAAGLLSEILIRDMLASITNMGQYAAAYSRLMPLMMAQQHQGPKPPSIVMDLSKRGIDCIKSYEGLSLTI